MLSIFREKVSQKNLIKIMLKKHQHFSLNAGVIFYPGTCIPPPSG